MREQSYDWIAFLVANNCKFSFAEFGKAAIVNISVPEHAVELGANITTTVNEISPNASNPDFDRLDCGIIPPDDPNYRIVVAQYDKHAMKFKTPSYGIPKSYLQRISYEGQLSFVIHQLNFKDKFLKVVCLLNYKNGSKTMHVESPVYEVKVIYGMFKIILIYVKSKLNKRNLLAMFLAKQNYALIPQFKCPAELQFLLAFTGLQCRIL